MLPLLESDAWKEDMARGSSLMDVALREIRWGCLLDDSCMAVEAHREVGKEGRR